MTKFLDRLFVWSGGAVFVTSLATTAWAFAFWWDEAMPWSGWGPIAVDTSLLAIFALHHSLFARTTMKAVVAKTVPERLIRSVYVWIASVLLILVCVIWRPVGGTLYDGSAGWLRILHLIVQLTGVWLIGRSVGAIDALELAGIRTPRRHTVTDTLQVRGPYRLVRHPLYLGWLLIVFGPSHMTGDRLTFAVITTVYLVVAIPWEERSLEDAFGKEYLRYKQLVPWRIVPYVY